MEVRTVLFRLQEINNKKSLELINTSFTDVEAQLDGLTALKSVRFTLKNSSEPFSIYREFSMF